jgi:exopolyphosphatase/guanosine-5'-triphosphate,3'-diphosphate pyrophosphatase
VLLHRRREGLDVLPKFTLQGKDYKLRFPKKWLAEHPLTLAGIEQEQQYYDNFGISFSYQ